MRITRNNVVCCFLVLLSCAFITFGLASSSGGSNSFSFGKMSGSQMLGVKGRIDCEPDKDKSCFVTGFQMPDVLDCDIAMVAQIPLKKDNETPAQYQERLKRSLPKCKSKETREQANFMQSIFYDSVKGKDIEFDKKYVCLQQGFCSGPGVPASQQKKNPNNHRKCIECEDPESYCLKCDKEDFENQPNDKQPDINKCKEPDGA